MSGGSQFCDLVPATAMKMHAVLNKMGQYSFQELRVLANSKSARLVLVSLDLVGCFKYA